MQKQHIIRIKRVLGEINAVGQLINLAQGRSNLDTVTTFHPLKYTIDSPILIAPIGMEKSIKTQRVNKKGRTEL